MSHRASVSTIATAFSYSAFSLHRRVRPDAVGGGKFCYLRTRHSSHGLRRIASRADATRPQQQAQQQFKPKPGTPLTASANTHGKESSPPTAKKKEEAKTAISSRGDTLLLVGLGNPGPRFDDTRHNIGFHLVDVFARRHAAPTFRHERSLQAQHTTVTVDNRIKVHILKPLTYMNNSGVSVRAALRHFSLPVGALLVVADDIAMELGRLRMRARGSAGGHNGLKSVQKAVGGMEYARLKVGVGVPYDAVEWADFVLEKFSRGDRRVVEEVEWDVMDVLDYWAREPDLSRVMNKLGMLQNGGNAKK